MSTIVTHYARPYSAPAAIEPLPFEPLQRILLASDGSPHADGAMRLARALAARDSAAVTLFSALEAQPYVIPFGTEGHVTLPTPEMKRVAESRRRLELAEQRHRTGSPPDRWPVLIEDGAPASLIAQTAVALEADLVLTGPERHGPVGRLLHGETALNVSRGGETPVLLVPSDAATIPATVVVGMDFSNTALHAARTATRVIGPAGTLLLVHVQPARSYSPEEEDDWRAQYEHGVDLAFERVITRLGARSGVAIQPVRLDGEPGRALLGFAREQNADMLAVGSRGHTILQRFLVGSVATMLVREARRTVLISPRGSLATTGTR